MSEKSPQRVQETLRKLNRGEQDEELYFDPDSGQLLARRSDRQPDPDAMPATQMAEEGFFTEHGR